MTIIEAITKNDDLKYNDYSDADKISWLSRLDGMVKKQIIDTHEGAERVVYSGYDENTDENTELLVQAPFDDIYLRWMEAQIDYHNGEFDKYNNSITMFNTAFTAFANYYNRTHMPLSGGNRFKF